MERINKTTYFVIGIICLFFVVVLLQIKGYYLTSYESKYVTSALFANSFFDILKANINGINVFEGGPLYFLIIRFFVKVFGSSSEFIVRLPSVLLSFLTATGLFAFCYKCINKKFAIITILTYFLNISFLTFSSVSIPQVIASDFALISVLLGCFPLFSESKNNEHLFFIGFWVFTFLIVFTDLFTAIVPFIVLILSYLFLKKLPSLFKPINFIMGFFSLFLVVYNWKTLAYKVSENIPLFDYVFNTGNIDIQPYLYVKYFIGLLAGLMPWSILFIALFGLVFTVGQLLKNSSVKEVNSESKFLLISFIGFLISSLVFFLNHSFSNVILATSFASICVSYFWYKHLVEDKYRGFINFSSAFFYGITLLFAVGTIVVYFFVDKSLKLYFEPLLIPLIVVTLLVSIPGLMVLVLDRKYLNYSIHLLFSVIFYFVLTGVLFNYLNSFGENELILYAFGAKDNINKLATYDLKNKYVIPYYYGNIVEFNDKLSAEDIYQKYGDTYDVRIIMKIKSLEDFDQNFVYELLESGKNYCVITNIKTLPLEYKNELKSNP